MKYPKKYRRKNSELHRNDLITAIQHTGDNAEYIKSFCPKAKHSSDSDFKIKGVFHFTDKEYEDGFFTFDCKVYGKRFLNLNQWIFEFMGDYYIHDDHKFKILFEEAI